MRSSWVLTTLLITGLAAGGADKADEKKAMVSGSITAKGETELEKDAVVQVSLVDVSRADAPAVVLGTTTIKDARKFPIEFAISYDPALVKEKARIGVQVRIMHGTKLSFITDTFTPAVTNGAPTKDIKVEVKKLK